MFSNSGISSSWGQPQQNQQQQPQQGTPAFGQPANSTFGTAGAFGSGGAFGQPQQPPQQQTNPMFGNLGATNTTNPAFGTPIRPTVATPSSQMNPGSTGTFGATNNASTGGGLFGPSKPATGFGAFSSGTGTFGGSGAGAGAFGATPAAGPSTGTSLFGNTANANPAGTGGFGGSSLFGAAKPAVGFGTTPSQAGGAFSTTADSVAPVTTGSSNPPYAVYDEKDSANANVTLHYQSITCMPAYRGSSFEELRFQDYRQGRKTAGAFGQTAFGGTQQQQQQPQSTGLFSQPATNTNTNTGSLFGGGGAFGSTNTAATGNTTGFGAFGQPANTTQPAGGGLFGGNTFGQPQQQQQAQPTATTGFGTFGQPQQQQQPAAGGLFNNSAFGNAQNQQKPAFGGFGGTNTTSTGAFGSVGAFGQSTQQQPTGSLFGSQQQQPQQQTSGFGGFGANTNAPKPSIFGNPQPAATGFGGFGQQQQNQQGQQQQGAQPAGSLFGGGGSLFSNPNQQQQQQQQQQQAGSLFGNTQPAGQQQAGGIFGNTAGGGLFSGATQQQQQQQPTQPGGFGNPFGAKPTAPAAPAGGGLFTGFGQSTAPTNTNTQAQSAGLFGNLGQSTTQQPASTGFGSGSLFGKPAGTTGFGGLQNTPQQGASTLGGGSLFGNVGASTNITTGQSQGGLTASIAQPIGANLPIWSMLPPGPRTVPLEQQPKKKPSFFMDVPTRSPVPRLQLGYTPAPSKLRGFASTSSPAPGSSLTFSSGNPNGLSLSKSSAKSILGPDAFLNGSSGSGLGSGSRHSVKKLTLDKKVEPTDFFKASTSQSKVIFSPALSVAAREIEAASSPQRPQAGGSTPQRPAEQRTPGRFTAQGGAMDASSSQKSADPAELQEGDYYVKPDLDALRRLSYEELCAFDGLVVGRIGYGEIHFLEAVDLTGLPRLGSLLGQLIRFDDKECSVYPDSDDVDKPPPGSGLNVKARIMLIRCWALDKATREPIKDDKHPLAVRHLKRLRHMKDTHFEAFDLEEGKWTFTVDHF